MKCGECTLCCDLFPVKWLDKPMNTSCVHCDIGCKIHETKPSECSDFNCAYVQMEKANIELRPDNCGVIFEKLSDNIFFGTLNPNTTLTEFGKKQVYNFVKQGYSVVLASIKKTTNKFFINENHIEEEIRKEFSNQLKVRYGNL